MIVLQPQGMSASQIEVSVSEDDAPEWDGATSYALNATVIRDHKIYVSVIADNLGIDPNDVDQSLVSAEWLFKSYTNAYSFLDGVLSNKTTSDETLVITFSGLDPVQGLVIFGAAGAELTVEAWTAEMGAMVFSQVVTLSGRLIGGWYDWLTKGFKDYSNKVVVKDIPAAATFVRVTIAGAAPAVGEIVLGDFIACGETQVDGTTGAGIALSTVDFNDFGRLSLTKRPTRVDMTYRVLVTASQFEAIKPILDDLQGQIVAVIGSEARPSTINLGVLGAPNWSEGGFDHYFYSITVRGVM